MRKHLVCPLSCLFLSLLIAACPGPQSPSGDDDLTGYTLQGAVRTPSGGGIENVEVQFSGGYGPVLTGSDGSWTRNGLSGTVTATPVLADHVFLPAERTYTDTASGADFTGGLARTLTIEPRYTTMNTAGEISKDPDLAAYPSGLSVTLTAQDGDDGDTFAGGWDQVIPMYGWGTNPNPTTITLDSDQTWYAIFWHTEVPGNGMDDDRDGETDEP